MGLPKLENELMKMILAAAARTGDRCPVSGDGRFWRKADISAPSIQ
jgi:hypothetical protein